VAAWLCEGFESEMIYFLLEEPSMKRALEKLLPRIIPGRSYILISHNGKGDLQNAIKTVVPTLSRQANAKIMILHDQDNHDCFELKRELKRLSEKSNCSVLIRIVCRELESWFLGDMKAVEQAYPRFKADKFRNKKKFRDVDIIQKPSEYLRKMVPELKKYDILPKLTVAEKIAGHMNTENNRSISFRHFVRGLEKLVSC